MSKHPKNPNLMTLKESREIIKSNLREMKKYEKLKRVKRTLADYTTVMKSSNNILEIENLETCFFTDNGVVRSVNNISFDVPKDSIVGLVGESGCGKTTLGRCIVRAYQPTSGSVTYTAEDGTEIDFLKIDRKTMKQYRKEIQMIFQDPYSSLDPRMTVLDIIKEPLQANFPKMPKEEMESRVMDIAAKVGLNTSYLKRYPHAFSGGQRQRIGIARALDRKSVV